MQAPNLNGLVLFDGDCNLCNGTMKFLVRNNPTQSLKFCPMQSPAGRAILQHLGLPTDSYTTMLFIDNAQVFQKSNAALHIARHLRWPWRCLWWARCIPRPFRDVIYSLVARNRYRLFGRRPNCALFDPAVKKRFIERI